MIFSQLWSNMTKNNYCALYIFSAFLKLSHTIGLTFNRDYTLYTLSSKPSLKRSYSNLSSQ